MQPRYLAGVAGPLLLIVAASCSANSGEGTKAVRAESGIGTKSGIIVPGFSYVNSYTFNGSRGPTTATLAIPAECDSSNPVMGILLVTPPSGGDTRDWYSGTQYEPFLHSHHFAFMGATSPDPWWTEAEPGLEASFQYFANDSGFHEVQDAPLLTTGLSSGGLPACAHFLLDPSKVIAATAVASPCFFFNGVDSIYGGQNPGTLWDPGSANVPVLTMWGAPPSPDFTLDNYRPDPGTSLSGGVGHAPWALLRSREVATAGLVRTR